MRALVGLGAMIVAGYRVWTRGPLPTAREVGNLVIGIMSAYHAQLVPFAQSLITLAAIFPNTRMELRVHVAQNLGLAVLSSSSPHDTPQHSPSDFPLVSVPPRSPLGEESMVPDTTNGQARSTKDVPIEGDIADEHTGGTPARLFACAEVR